MERMERIDPEVLLRKGLRELRHHRPDLALSLFRSAVDLTPAACADKLSRALYWLSVSLLRLDNRDLAVKSLASAQKLRRRGVARRSYLNRVNEYGMLRRPTEELDDFYAYTSIQIAAYLGKKQRPRFESMAEHDAVLRIVGDAWMRLKRTGLLDGLECGEKLRIFKQSDPPFPAFGLSPDGYVRSSIRLSRNPQPPAGHGTTVIRLESGRPDSQPSADSRCPCGSGLPYRKCCGRVPGLREL